MVSCLLPMTQRVIHTRFRYAYAPKRLKLAIDSNSPVHHTKGTRSAIAPKSHRPPTACRYTVSGSFNSPWRGPFHRSVALLIHYRSLEVFSLTRWSSQIPTGFLVPRSTWEISPLTSVFTYRTFTFCGRAFQPVQLTLINVVAYSGSA